MMALFNRSMASAHKRIRLTSAAPHAPELEAVVGAHPIQKSQDLWVDMLPPDVCDRVVVHACKGFPNAVALRLAQTSAALRRSVFSVLNNTLTFLENDARLTEMLCWVDLFGNDVEKLNFEKFSDEVWYSELAPRAASNTTDGGLCLELVRLTAPFLSSPNILAVHISDRPEHLAALCLSSSIIEVVVYCRGSASGFQVFQSLANIPVQKLGTICHNYRTCPYADPNAFGSNLNALATSCPYLHSLDVDCSASCCLYQDINDNITHTMQHPIWEALPPLGQLRELSCSDAVSGSLVEQFGGDNSMMTEGHCRLTPRVKHVFDSVKLRRMGTVVQGSPRISVIELHTEDPKVYLTELDARMLMREQLVGLSKCHFLRKVEFNVTEMSEAAFAEAIRNLPELEKLHVCWQTEIVHGYVDYREARPGVILSAVQHAKKLSDLHLTDVRIELSEMNAIMESLGLQLRNFKTSIFNQEESPLERLVALFQTAAKHNGELREFGIYDRWSNDDVCSSRKERGRNQVLSSYHGDAARRDRLVQQASSMLVRLKMNAPYLWPVFSCSWWYGFGKPLASEDPLRSRSGRSNFFNSKAFHEVMDRALEMGL